MGGNHKAGEVQGQSRQHARLINLLGVKQLIIGVNKMDTDTAGPYAKARYDEVGGEMKNMLIKVGWKKDFVEKSTPVLPISGWMATTSSRRPRTWAGGRAWISSSRRPPCTSTPCTTASTTCARRRAATTPPPCACRCRA